MVTGEVAILGVLIEFDHERVQKQIKHRAIGRDKRDNDDDLTAVEEINSISSRGESCRLITESKGYQSAAFKSTRMCSFCFLTSH